MAWWNGMGTVVARIISHVSYADGTTEQEVYEYVNGDSRLKRIKGTIDITIFTAGRKITVRTYEKLEGAYPADPTDAQEYTVGTDPIPYFDFVSQSDVKITMQEDIAEGGAVDVSRSIMIQQME